MEDALLYLKSADLNVRLILKIPSEKHLEQHLVDYLGTAA